MVERYRTRRVFVAGGMPYHTYVSRIDRDIEGRLQTVQDNLCKLVTVTGATKSGKTVLAKKVLDENSIWVDGGTIKLEDDLWNSILESIDGYNEVSYSETYGTNANIRGDGSTELQIPLLAKGKAKIGADYGTTRGTQSSARRVSSPRQSAINQLKESNRALIIDDFHYLNRDFQGSIIRALKPLIFEGLPIVLIAIPHRRYDAIRVEREITGRLEAINIPSWDKEEILQIPREGFPLLNLDVSEKVCNRLAEEAYGSPHLMQEFCKELALSNGIEERTAQAFSINEVSDQLFSHVAEGTGKVIFDKLATGPRQRSDRIPRKFKNGNTDDIYGVVLYALARLGPGLDTIEYEVLRGAIRDILADNIPQAHEVTRVLEKMAEIATGDEASTPVLDWDKGERKLHITDPFFAFFLKWGVS